MVYLKAYNQNANMKVHSVQSTYFIHNKKYLACIRVHVLSHKKYKRYECKNHNLIIKYST
jgi:hypothetical protein